MEKTECYSQAEQPFRSSKNTDIYQENNKLCSVFVAI